MVLTAFRDKTIVITGASGFIGTALTRKLSGVSCSIRCVSRHVADNRRPYDTKAHIDHICADLTQDEPWEEILPGADFFFHLSAQTNLYFAEENPDLDALANIVPMRKLADYAADHDCSRLKVLFASTPTILGLDHDNPADESMPDQPVSVYDFHKQAAEQILRHAAQQKTLKGCSLRLANVYGYGCGAKSKNANRGILNLMMERAANGEALSLYGEGQFIRDFTHIDDVVEAFIAAALSEKTDGGRYYIVAGQKGYSLRAAFELIARLAKEELGQSVSVIREPAPEGLHPIERRDFVGNCTLLEKDAGWRPATSLQAGVRRDLHKFAEHYSER